MPMWLLATLLLLLTFSRAEIHTPIFELEVQLQKNLSPSFLQGLVIDNARAVDSHEISLYLSTGKWGSSKIRNYLLLDEFDESNSILEMQKEINLSNKVFGEGICIHKGRLYQLTLYSRIVYIYNKDDLTLMESLTLPEGISQGWGITSNGDYLIISEGSDILYICDDKINIVEIKLITDNGNSVMNLNELEWINGTVFANILGSSCICVVLLDVGIVTAWLDASSVINQERIYQENKMIQLDNNDQKLRKNKSRMMKTNDVLNGIAYDDVNKQIFISGKNWLNLYAVRRGMEKNSNGNAFHFCKRDYLL